MFTATKLAQKAEVSLYTVRYYTRIGLLKPARNPRNDYKQYQTSDITRLRFISAAKNLGFTLSEITQILKDATNGKSPCPSVRKIIVYHIEENKRQIQELQKLQKKMEKALGEWQNLKDSVPSGDSVCGLIEAVGKNDAKIK